ncbi:hypothetical protein L6Q21_11070 [Sandaracinobacter sp. RS1-74]|uniref:hypothetical protein n=1 Tax=Sandaracinobacteroides sayramensis TaxID=2913411 RepID=UPI001EDA46F6|nr:hypothetical protein [Sandaracinobacteroides sayramensis]MCG2841521.1 hypothetical protein [Sandaracinobacteroides sayramensis]
MDLSGHRRFREGVADWGEARGRDCVGRTLLARGWAALESARAETLDIELRGGGVVRAVLALRVEGGIAEASTRRGEWTHIFALEDVALVRCNPRGAAPQAEGAIRR